MPVKKQGRARALDSEYYIFVEKNVYDVKFSAELKQFLDIEDVSLRFLVFFFSQILALRLSRLLNNYCGLQTDRQARNER